MYHGVLLNASLYEFLYRVDCDLAKQTQGDRCPHCGGPLHQDNYPRKPRGAGCRLGPEYQQRLSFCCARKGCRRRALPPSVRFLGRKVYLGVVIVLCTAMQHGVNASRGQQLAEQLGVPRQTLLRWRTYWQQVFVQTRFWKQARGHLLPPVSEAELPGSLLVRFAGDLRSRLILLLKFLLPITTS